MCSVPTTLSNTYRVTQLTRLFKLFTSWIVQNACKVAILHWPPKKMLNYTTKKTAISVSPEDNFNHPKLLTLIDIFGIFDCILSPKAVKENIIIQSTLALLLLRGIHTRYFQKTVKELKVIIFLHLREPS